MTNPTTFVLFLTSWLTLSSGANRAESAAQSDSAGPARSQIRPSLELGKRVQETLEGGEQHIYELELQADHYLYLAVEERGIDLEVTLLGPDGALLARSDGPAGRRSLELLAHVTRSGGLHPLKIRAKEDEPEGAYVAWIDELRPARPDDPLRVKAETAYAKARQIQAVESADAYRRSIELYQAALPLWRQLGDPRGQAFVINNMGLVHRRLGETDKALELYLQALPLWRESGDQRGEGDTLNNIGLVLRLRGDMAGSQGYYEESLELRRAIGDRRGVAQTLSNLGVVSSSLGEPRRALDYHSQALELNRELGNRTREATILSNIGVVLRQLGELSSSLEHHQEALAISEAAGERALQAAILRNMGRVHEARGDTQAAFSALREALLLYRSVGSLHGQAVTLEILANLYDQLGDLTEARLVRHEALALHRKVEFPQGEAWDLFHLGRLSAGAGETSQAQTYFHEALLLSREIGDRRLEGALLDHLGRLDAAAGRFDEAAVSYRQALDLHRAVENRAGLAETLNSLGRLQLEQGQISEARGTCRQALAHSRAVGNPTLEAASLLDLARIERADGRPERAHVLVEEAVTSIEAIRQEVVSPELRSTYLALKHSYYELYVDVLMRLHQRQPEAGYDRQAFRVSERARARGLLDLLREAGAQIHQGVDAAMLKREAALRRALNGKELYRMELLAGSPSQAELAGVEEEIDQLLRQHRQARDQIRLTSPRYAALTQPEPLAVKTIQRQVLDADTALLEYFLGEERSFLWLVTPSSLKTFQLPGRAEIESLARRLYELLTARNQPSSEETPGARRARLSRADQELHRAAAELSRVVLAPAAGDLVAKRLLISSQGALQYVPFAVLPIPGQGPVSDGEPDEKAEPLLARFEVVSVPSASVLAELRRDIENRGSATRRLAVLADPVFEREDPRVAQTSRALEPNMREAPDDARFLRGDPIRSATPRRFRRLRFSRAEAEAIMGLAPEHETMQALDFDASRSLATSGELAQYRFLHLGTHGILDSERPRLSAVVLSLVDETGRPRDGYLRLHDIYNLRLNADLVVLSSCETALGREIRGEGLVGLTRGFFYAGARQVVASLWGVHDKATAELMTRFYRLMLGPERLPAVSALRQAQLAMWREERWTAPYYWAGFVHQGDWRP